MGKYDNWSWDDEPRKPAPQAAPAPAPARPAGPDKYKNWSWDEPKPAAPAPPQGPPLPPSLALPDFASPGIDTAGLSAADKISMGYGPEIMAAGDKARTMWPGPQIREALGRPERPVRSAEEYRRALTEKREANRTAAEIGDVAGSAAQFLGAGKFLGMGRGAGLAGNIVTGGATGAGLGLGQGAAKMQRGEMGEEGLPRMVAADMAAGAGAGALSPLALPAAAGAMGGHFLPLAGISALAGPALGGAMGGAVRSIPRLGPMVGGASRELTTAPLAGFGATVGEATLPDAPPTAEGPPAPLRETPPPRGPGAMGQSFADWKRMRESAASEPVGESPAPVVSDAEIDQTQRRMLGPAANDVQPPDDEELRRLQRFLLSGVR